MVIEVEGVKTTYARIAWLDLHGENAYNLMLMLGC